LSMDLVELCSGLQVNPLPPPRERCSDVAHAPNRNHNLSSDERIQAIKNALRYFPKKCHRELASEFAKELDNFGHIYMYRFMPDTSLMRAYPISEYKTETVEGAAVILMIMNNLDRRVAQFPEELVTYGGNGQVFSNWAQFRITLHYLSTMTNKQTLSMMSGHPAGLFPSHKKAPRVVITNGMMIPNYSTKDMYDKLFAMGCTMYGQMTAGSYCYIGPQGIVHGTTITVMNAGRQYLGPGNMAGKVYVTAGLGGMSGAQGKAIVIAGCVGVVAEVSREALDKRHAQGWIQEVVDSVEDCIELVRQARKDKRVLSIGFYGNIVSLWEGFAAYTERTEENLVELASDQTSLHNPFNGGYYPVQLSYEESNSMMNEDPAQFKSLVQESLRRHVKAVNYLCGKGMNFWDYGNAFLLEASRAGADVTKPDGSFIYPTYVQLTIGNVFSLGFGPFRWVCTSGLEEDLQKTDEIAAGVIREQLTESPSAEEEGNLRDNLTWVEKAMENKMVVGSQARILYSNQAGRSRMAAAFNKAVASGEISAPVVLSRDHHDVSGTDSPYRETSNITDGSMWCADMAVQNVIGDALRGATYVSIHNGGGVGWGEVMNGGFGMVLDGSEEAGESAVSMLHWDVSNGVCRRAWDGHPLARHAISNTQDAVPGYRITMCNVADQESLQDL